MFTGGEFINKTLLSVRSLCIQHRSAVTATGVDVNIGEVHGLGRGGKTVLGQ